MNRIALVAASIGASAGTAQAEVSREWSEYAAEIKADCASFEATLPDPVGDAPKLAAWNRVSWPYAPARPHICIFLRFDVDSSGRPQNVDVAHLAPDNVKYRFKREAMLTVNDMSFELSAATPDGFKGMWVQVDYDACGPKLKHRCIRMRLPGRE